MFGQVPGLFRRDLRRQAFWWRTLDWDARQRTRSYFHLSVRREVSHIPNFPRAGVGCDSLGEGGGRVTRPNEGAAPNAGGRRLFAVPTLLAARVGELFR